jgi:Fic family protein
MNRADFDNQAPGTLVQTPDADWAFVPAPLPPSLNLDIKMVNLLTDAERSLGELSGIGKRLPNPHLLIGPFLSREAILSSRIEGTHATAQELALFEAEVPSAPVTQDVKEVANYVAAMKYGLKKVKELPVCLRLIKELHEILLHDVRGQEHTPGEFRIGQNYIGTKGQTPAQARFVPPPVAEMNQCLQDLEKYVGSLDDLPVLIQLALIHYQFETIHPFMDGNGRIGRLLTSLLMCERGCLSQPLLYLSAYLETHRDEYMNRLLEVSQKGRWYEWVKFFIEGVADQAKDAINRTNKLYSLWDSYRMRLHSARSSALCLKLVDELFKYPVITISQARKLLNVTTHSAQNNVSKLEKNDILVEVTGRLRNRTYVAPAIIQIIEQEHVDANDSQP